MPFDFAPFAEVAGLLYGPWAAERTAAVGAVPAEAVHPVVRGILAAGAAVTGAALFAAQHRLAALRRETAAVWRDMDLLLLPTTPTAYSLAQVAAEPVALNSRLGTYTNFVNLLDMAAIAVPGGFHADGFPHGRDAGRPGLERPRNGWAGVADAPRGGNDAGATGARQPHGDVEVAVFGRTWRASR